ncbi:MAG: UxaA family hydrolase [Chloroflexota bacterium]
MILSSSFSKIAIRLSPRDPLAVARCDIPAGSLVRADDPALPFTTFTVGQAIPAGHKLAIRPIACGEEVLRYGHPIGVATQAIAPGDWIHTHNLSVGNMQRGFSRQVVEIERAASDCKQTFLGYPRPNGQAGTRNLIAVVATVSCAAQTARAIAHAFSAKSLAAYPHVSGIVAITHSLGCCSPLDSLSQRYLQRTLYNLAIHPNIGGALYVSLGCEGNQMGDLLAPLQAPAGNTIRHPLLGPFLAIQECGGIQKTVTAGVEAIQALLPLVNHTERAPLPLSRLVVALQCGGSDGWSGVTANPLVGNVADRLVAQGGSVVLAETPEIYGAEQLLACRVASENVGQALAERLRWWQEHARQNGFNLDSNPSPGNKAGGLTTIYEKSLGAMAKGGRTPLVQVLAYGERVTTPGLVFMDTPGYDPASVTGQVAGGCNLVLFTTGRGTVFGGSVAPCIKIASNTPMYRRMHADMDFNAGAILDGQNMNEAAQALLAQAVQIASGMPTQSERSLFREAEFVPWHLGGML